MEILASPFHHRGKAQEKWEEHRTRSRGFESLVFEGTCEGWIFFLRAKSKPRVPPCCFVLFCFRLFKSHLFLWSLYTPSGHVVLGTPSPAFSRPQNPPHSHKYQTQPGLVPGPGNLNLEHLPVLRGGVRGLPGTFIHLGPWPSDLVETVLSPFLHPHSFL